MGQGGGGCEPGEITGRAEGGDAPCATMMAPPCAVYHVAPPSFAWHAALALWHRVDVGYVGVSSDLAHGDDSWSGDQRTSAILEMNAMLLR